MTLNDDNPVVECTTVLYDHSARVNKVDHCEGLSWTKECRYCSSTRFMTSFIKIENERPKVMRK